MTATTMTSREFNQDASRAKRAAESGPVFITDRGTPAHVLLTVRDYEALLGAQPNIVELLAMPGADDIAFDPPRSRVLHRPADLSDDDAPAPSPAPDANDSARHLTA